MLRFQNAVERGVFMYAIMGWVQFRGNKEHFGQKR